MDNFSLTNFEKQVATVFGPIIPEHVAVIPAKSAASSEAATHNLTNQGLLPALHLQDGLNLLDRNFNSLNYFADQAESMFAGLDKDKNGFISQKELSQAIADPRNAGRKAEILSVLLQMELNPQFFDQPFLGQKPDSRGITKRDIEALRHSPGQFLELGAIMQSAADKIACEKSLFGNKGVSPDAIHQGVIGDCVIEATLASLAADHPEQIRQMIKANRNGTYTVTTPGGIKETVSAPTDAELAIGNQSKDYGVWPIVLEKALAQYLNGQENDQGPHRSRPYADLSTVWQGADPKEALAFLTGKLFTGVMVDPRADQQFIGEFMADALAGKRLLITSADKTKSRKTADGFTGFHAYSVIAFDQKGLDGGTVTLRNPWGGQNGTSSGEWQMSLKEFCRNFEEVYTSSGIPAKN